MSGYKLQRGSVSSPKHDFYNHRSTSSSSAAAAAAALFSDVN